MKLDKSRIGIIHKKEIKKPYYTRNKIVEYSLIIEKAKTEDDRDTHESLDGYDLFDDFVGREVNIRITTVD